MTLVVGLSRRGRLVLVAAGLWQLASWGGRISLLTGAEAADPWTWYRVVGGLATGLGVLLVAVAWRLRRRPIALGVVWAYLVVALATWGRSMWVVWSEPNTAAFRVVHSLLAITTWALGVAAVASVSRAPVWEVTSGGPAGAGEAPPPKPAPPAAPRPADPSGGLAGAVGVGDPHTIEAGEAE